MIFLLQASERASKEVLVFAERFSKQHSLELHVLMPDANPEDLPSCGLDAMWHNNGTIFAVLLKLPQEVSAVMHDTDTSVLFEKQKFREIPNWYEYANK